MAKLFTRILKSGVGDGIDIVGVVVSMGVGDGSNAAGVMVSMGEEVKAGVEEGSIIGTPGAVHAEHRIRMKRKTRDFIFAFHRMCLILFYRLFLIC